MHVFGKRKNGLIGLRRRCLERQPDAKFADDEEDKGKTVGKLVQNEAFRARMQSLLSPREEMSGERPFYVSSDSSPFFSR